MKEKNLRILKYILVFVISIILFYVLQFSLELFLCPDSYYHLKMAEMMLHGKLVFHSFPWLQFTVLKDHYLDQHFLFHIILIPFIALKPIIGAKIADVVFASLACLAFYFLLEKNKVSLAFWWTIVFLASSSSFLFRMILIRDPTLSLLFLILVLFVFYYDFEQKWLKYSLIALLSFAYVWLYGGFIFLILFAFVFYLCKLIFARKFEWREILFCFGAIIVSILLDPYCKNFISFFSIQVFGTGPFTKIPVGAEWYPFSDWDFLWNNFLSILAFVIGIIVLTIDILLKKYRENKNLFAFKITLFIISLFFFVLTLRSQRFVEVMVPFLMIFSAFCLSDYLKKVDVKKWYKGLMECLDLKEHFYSTKNWLRHYWLMFFNLIMLFIIMIFVGIVGVGNVIATYESTSNSSADNVPDIKNAADWLTKNTPENSIILNLDWSDFPPLFLYDSRNYYGFGLDPTFTYNLDKDLYEKWQGISSGRVDAYQTIKNDFKSNYVLVNNKNKHVFNMFNDDPRFEKVFDSKYCRIYRLN